MQAYGHKKVIANKPLLVKDMAVIHNKEDAVSVDMFVQGTLESDFSDQSSPSFLSDKEDR